MKEIGPELITNSPGEQDKLHDDTKNTYCLSATDESPDAVTKSIAEVNVTIAKVTKIRQDEHLDGPVILPVKDERLILSGCGDDDSLDLFLEQLPSPTWMQLRLGTSREELPTRQLVLPFSARSADSTTIISLIMETAIAHRKGEHVMKEREALESSRS